MSKQQALLKDERAGLATCVTDPVEGSFMIPAQEVQRLMSQQGLSMEEFLMSLIQPASRLARSPISGYHVGWVQERAKIRQLSEAAGKP